MKELGELYKEKLQHYTATPDEKVWNSIVQDKTLKAFNRRKRFLKSMPYVISSVAIVGLSVALFFVFKPKDEKTQSTKTLEVHTQPLPVVNSDTFAIKENLSAQVRRENKHIATPQQHATSVDTKDSMTKSSSNLTKGNVEEEVEIPTVFPPSNHITPIHDKENKTTLKEIKVVDTLPNNIENSPPPAPLFGDPLAAAPIMYSKDTSVCRNSKLTLFVKNALQVRWDIGLETSEIEIYPDRNQIYHVDVVNANGKDTTLSIRVDVFDCKLFIPNAFTPNGDGKNDFFKVESPIEISNFNMSIFETSGRLLFNTQNITQGWDGNYEGKYAPEGAYLYIITYKDITGEKHYEKGQLILYR